MGKIIKIFFKKFILSQMTLILIQMTTYSKSKGTAKGIYFPNNKDIYKQRL
jgi:hypothetical protein